MRWDQAFRTRLLAQIFAVVGLTAPAEGCSDDASEPEPQQACFTWPDATLCGGTSAGGAGGADGEASGTGGGGSICPSAEEAPKYLSPCGAAVAVHDNGALVNGQCCYDVSYGTGRPFRIAGRSRTARSEQRASTWSVQPTPILQPRSDSERAKLAETWTRDGLHEHASIASFARLSLELLAFGAPSELIAEVHRAALDEVRHAQLCFGVASAYAGAPVGASRFELPANLPLAADLAALAEDAVVGCIGETIGALRAAEAATAEPDPVLRDVLAEIAEDEASHALLGWRLLRWIIDRGGERARSAAVVAFAGRNSGADDESVLAVARALLGSDATNRSMLAPSARSI